MFMLAQMEHLISMAKLLSLKYKNANEAMCDFYTVKGCSSACAIGHNRSRLQGRP